MRTSSGQAHPPPDDPPRKDDEPFNPSRLLIYVWRLFSRRPRLFQRTEDQQEAAAERPRKSFRRALASLALRLLPVWIGFIIVLAVVPGLPNLILKGAGRIVTGILRPDEIVVVVGEPGAQQEEPAETAPLWSLELSPVFTQEVEFWADDIATWSLIYQIPPNFIATIMQIESCGDPSVVSSAGAGGLFQVMPYHFEPGEEAFDPNDNARAGLSFMAELLELSGGEVEGALAGYNGGPGLMDAPRETWPNETRRYVYWGTGIYADVVSGAEESPRLDEWLGNGGYVLCQRAATRLGLVATPYAPPASTGG